MGRFSDEDINGKLAEFKQHNPTIIGEPRELTAAEIDKRLGGLPKVLEMAYAYIATGLDNRHTRDMDIPLLVICGMARQSGFFDAYCTIRHTQATDRVSDQLVMLYRK